MTKIFTFLDPRVQELPFMATPWWNTGSTLLYLFIVFYIGPKYIKGKQPVNLKAFLFIYNMTLVVFNGYLFYEVTEIQNVKKNEE